MTLKAQNVEFNEADSHLLTHLIMEKLDRSIREAWELSLGSSVNYPTLKSLNEFLLERARAQENYEGTTPSSANLKGSSQSSQKSSKFKQNAYAHVATSDSSQCARSSQSTPEASLPKKTMPRPQYPCDICGGEHYVVRCE